MSSYSEGFERGSTKSSIQFLSYRRPSAGEVPSQLYIALGMQYISEKKFKGLYEAAATTIRLTSGFVKCLEKTHYRGTNYKTPKP